MSITIRAVGQASRRGATRRVPNAAALLEAVDEWLVAGAAETLRGHIPGARTLDDALEVSLHPAAPPVRFEATDTGRLVAEAQTVPVGPGYHTYVAGLLRRLGDELDVEWSGPESDEGAPLEPVDDDDDDERGSLLSRATSLPGAVVSRATTLPGAVVSRATTLPGAVVSRATALPGAVVSRATGVDGEIEPSSDPTGTFFSGARADAERGHLAWLRSSLVAVQDARRRRVDGLHLGTPAGVRYEFEGAVATVLGPRDDAWLERALADPRIAAEIWPWVADAMDARYHLNRALVLLWTEVRWRPPVGDRETAVLDDVLATFRFAYPLDPSLPWPWPEWREAFVLRGLADPATFQMLQRATARPGLRAPGPPPGTALLGQAEPAPTEPAPLPEAIGYRRRPVTVIHEGWALELPGSFTEERTAEEWSGSDVGRTVTLAATTTADGDRPMSADAFLRNFASELGRDAIEHLDGPVRGRGRLFSDSSTGVDVATVEGYSAVNGSGAVIRIVIEDPEDWKWALDTWRSLRPA